MKGSLLITGSTGFLGKPLTQKLLSNKYYLIGLYKLRNEKLYDKETFTDENIFIKDLNDIQKNFRKILMR